MNITLSADKELIEQAREYAKERGTSLNQMIRDYLEKVTRSMSREEAAEEFARIARQYPGHSEPGTRFDREECHRRGRDAA